MYLLKQLQRRIDKSAFHHISDNKLNEYSKQLNFRKLNFREQQAVQIFDFRDVSEKNPNNNFFITSEHASNNLQKYHLGSTQLRYANTEYVYDKGAKEVATELAEESKTFLIMPNFSRLIIDPNRSLVSPSLFRKTITKEELLINRDGIEY
jgi:predicted N-formylglutamate amidohydrolase